MDKQKVYKASMKKFTSNLLSSEYINEDGHSKSGFRGDEKVTFTLSELADIINKALDESM